MVGVRREKMSVKGKRRRTEDRKGEIEGGDFWGGDRLGFVWRMNRLAREA